ncbi:hypothetical protein TWF506_004390 [Arthrobotrys conoides]|uniref:BTB domain-containing protein n=1 Tax=Arthrobotrys conoides TaxID=74498 RepID=A0AAN8N2L4_9PEZI
MSEPEESVVEVGPEQPAMAATSRKPVLRYMLETGDFSDITIFVGSSTKKTPFNLHRSVICANSEFFKAACKPGIFKEGADQEIILPEIDPATFKRVVAWQYEQGYQVPWSSGYYDLLMFQAADYLQIQPLRHEILNYLSNSCQLEFCYPQNDNSPVENFLPNFIKLCELCNKSDVEVLSSIAVQFVYHWEFAVADLMDDLDSGMYGSLFVAVIIGAHHRTPCCRECGARTPPMDQERE